MQPQNLSTGEDRAVSPVIGVVLMVAITVILASVIGSFVLGLGNNLQQTAPQASFECTSTTSVAMQGGDSIEDANLRTENGNGVTFTSGSAPLTAGDEVDLGSDNVLVWDNGENSQILIDCS